MDKSKTTFVIGHKNPDTDAICSAIAYASYLRATGHKNVEAARCGEVNNRTDFVLNKARLPYPKLLMDARATIGQICQRQVISVNTQSSIQEAFNLMRERELRSIPVLNEERTVEGMLSLLKMLNLLLPNGDAEQARIVKTSLHRICKTLDGSFIMGFDTESENDFIITVAAMSADVFSDKLKDYPPECVVLVVGNRPTIQRPAIEYGVRAIIVTGGYELNEDLLELARKKNVTIISSNRDTASTTLLIKCSKRISHALNKDFVSFTENHLVESVKKQIIDLTQVLYPVYDDKEKLVGVFSKSDLVNPSPCRLILVDHNEFSQAVTGTDQAEVVEVIDHHKLGGNLTSKEPIRFIMEPIGSTCSIVARMFREAGIEPDKSIALCMAAGIISDTLLLTSPTTTDQDKEILDWLTEISQENMKNFADEIFATGSVLQGSSAADAIHSDFKEYEEEGWKIAVAQIEELGLDNFWSRKKELSDALADLLKAKDLDFACVLITDIARHYSLMLVEGEKMIIDRVDYPQLEQHLFELEGIVSRKKQLIPVLMRVLGQCTREA